MNLLEYKLASMLLVTQQPTSLTVTEYSSSTESVMISKYNQLIHVYIINQF